MAETRPDSLSPTVFSSNNDDTGFGRRIKFALKLACNQVGDGVRLKSLLKQFASEEKALRQEKQQLREQLDAAQSKIFSLQPFLQDTTPDEIVQEYDAVVGSVQDWIAKLMEPWLQDSQFGAAELQKRVIHRPADVERFRAVLNEHADLINAATFPEMDEDILTCLIMRYIWNNIISTELYGSIPNYTGNIRLIERSMSKYVVPPRDAYTIRNWRAETFNALISVRNFPAQRKRRQSELANELSKLLSLFDISGDQKRFVKSVKENCIVPATRLHEKIVTSCHEFTCCDQEPGLISSDPIQEVVSFLGDKDSKNLFKHRKSFSIDKIVSESSWKELEETLYYVGTVVPGLAMQGHGQKGDDAGERIILRRQEVLVGCASEEERQNFLGNSPVSCIQVLCS